MKQRNRDSANQFYKENKFHCLSRIMDRWYGFTDEERRAERRRANRLYKFGLTLEQYEDMLFTQNHSYAICHEPETHRYKGMVTELVVDHDRSCCPTKKSCGQCIRGLLCHNCNSALGMLKDNLHALTAAFLYLKSHTKKRANDPT